MSRINLLIWRMPLNLILVVLLASCQGQPIEKLETDDAISDKNPTPTTPITDRNPSPTTPIAKTPTIPVSNNYTTYENLQWGFSFDYPQGFVLDERRTSVEPSVLDIVELWTQEDDRAIQAGKYQDGEYPPNVIVSIHQNAQNLSLQAWVENTNWFVTPNNFTPITIAGKEGLKFQSTGLYESEYIVIPLNNSQQILAIGFAEGSDSEAEYRQAFTSIIDTLQLVDKSPSSLQFEDYPASEVFTGNPAAVDLNSHPQARRFRTALQEGIKNGANFAGKYAVVTIGCGTSCQQIAIVDVSTGKVFMSEVGSELGVKHRLDSRLLVINPPENLENINLPEELKTQYFVWENNSLRSLN
ncbi:MAG: hypothetical protein SAL07_03555 [Oscillatoria sp. PMC 1051.18]|nr:hypothetical protein [Oscillatoria sp. PMC 1050.18]MEC5028966.1 hypothetical protein [Oscillatoria sp. PMC 1051.18]